MKPNHHLDDATLMAYAAGTLGEALSGVVAGHLDWCCACRRKLAELETIGAALTEELEPVAMSAGSFERVLERARAVANVHELPRRSMPAKRETTLPASLVKRLGGDIETVSWKWMAPGVRFAPVPVASPNNGDLRLLMIEGGRRMPEHGHGGSELTLVLSGAYHDRFGTFARGDVADMDEDVEHEPIVDGLEPCICLVAAEEPARFKSLVGRIAQPFIGM